MPGAFSEIPGDLDYFGIGDRLALADLESLNDEVWVHHVRRRPDLAEIGFDRHHLSGFAQWCQFSVWGHGGGQRTTPAGALGSKGMA